MNKESSDFNKFPKKRQPSDNSNMTQNAHWRWDRITHWSPLIFVPRTRKCTKLTIHTIWKEKKRKEYVTNVCINLSKLYWILTNFHQKKKKLSTTAVRRKIHNNTCLAYAISPLKGLFYSSTEPTTTDEPISSHCMNKKGQQTEMYVLWHRGIYMAPNHKRERQIKSIIKSILVHILLRDLRLFFFQSHYHCYICWFSICFSPATFYGAGSISYILIAATKTVHWYWNLCSSYVRKKVQR